MCRVRVKMISKPMRVQVSSAEIEWKWGRKEENIESQVRTNDSRQMIAINYN